MTPADSWNELVEALDQLDAESVIAVLERTPRSQRREWPKQLRRLRRAPDGGEFLTFDYTALVRVAELVCASDARTVARMVHQQTLFYHWKLAPRLFAAMEVDWLPELLDLLAVYDDRGETWDVAEALRLYLGAPYPLRDGYLTVLVRRLYRPDMVRRRLLGDAELVDLVPRILEVPEIGVHLARRDDPDATPRPGSPNDTADSVERVLVELIDAGRLDRAVVFERTRRALVTGGKPAHIAFFVRLHDKLQPTPTEIAASTDNYVELLSFGAGSAASAGLRALTEIWAEGLLAPQVPIDLTTTVLTRPVKTLVMAHLRWLSQIAERSPDLKSAVADAAQTGLDHDRADVRDAVQALLSQCGQEQVAVTTAPRCNDGASPTYSPQPVAPPLADIGELVEAVTRSIDECDVLLIERIADGLSRLGSDRHALSTAFAPLESQLRWYHDDSQGQDRGRFGFDRWRYRPHLSLLVDCMKGTFGSQPPRYGFGSTIAIASRLQEVAAAVTAGTTRPLLALPTATNGQLDPETLLGRVRDLESAGLDAGPSDIEQAWLRLPDVYPTGFLDALRELTTPTGQALAELVATGPLPAPTAQISWRGHTDPNTGRKYRTPTVTVSGPTSPVANTVCRQTADWSWDWIDDPGPPFGALWLMPQHREVAAAELVPFLSRTDDPVRVRPLEIVSQLPFGQGELGLCGHTMLALAAGNASQRMRSVAGQTLAALADQRAITPSQFATACHDTFADDAPPKRLADVLAELSRQTATTRLFITQTVIEWLPDLLRSGWREAPRLLMIAADAANGLGLRATSPDLNAVADDAAKKRINVEARRLRSALSA